MLDPEPPHFDVPRLREFLTGRWSVERRIDDRRLGLGGRFFGNAVFEPRGADLRYAESGQLHFGPYRGSAEQHYDFIFRENGTAEVRFADGRHFYDLDLRTGQANVRHPCVADLYLGRFEVLSESLWRVRWTVRGPRKDQRILTRYTRLPGRAAPPLD